MNVPIPRFNHMELTFPRGSLTKDTVESIDAFFCGVFGWTSIDASAMSPGCHLLTPDGLQQFLLLAEVDEPMPQPPDFGLEPGQAIFVPHLGLYYDTFEDIEELMAECQRFQEKDDRVRIRDFPPYNMGTGMSRVFYVHYLLPIWFDVQSLQPDPGHEPEKTWSFG